MVNGEEPNKPWITQPTLQLVKKERKIEQRRQNSTENENEYRKLCNGTAPSSMIILGQHSDGIG